MADSATTLRAVIVHQKDNDPSAAPIGDTGPRVACGVMGVGNSES